MKWFQIRKKFYPETQVSFDIQDSIWITTPIEKISFPYKTTQSAINQIREWILAEENIVTIMGVQTDG